MNETMATTPPHPVPCRLVASDEPHTPLPSLTDADHDALIQALYHLAVNELHRRSTLDGLHLSHYAVATLRRAKCHTLYDLASMEWPSILRMTGLTTPMLREVLAVLNVHGLTHTGFHRVAQEAERMAANG